MKKKKRTREKKVEIEILNEIKNLHIKLHGNLDHFDYLTRYNPVKQAYMNEDLRYDEDKLIYEFLSKAVQHITFEHFFTNHITDLKKDYKRMVRVDAYGLKEETEWKKKTNSIAERILYESYHLELNKIFSNLKCLPGLSIVYTFPEEIDLKIEEMANELSFQVEYEVENEGNNEEYKNLLLKNDMTGMEYEYAIADYINHNSTDWSAKVSKGSGDQGLDIMIENNTFHFTIGAQCKYYSTPVGNKAVQEAHAASSYYDTNLSCVITNHSFTKSANNLADRTDVELLHHDLLLDWLNDINNQLQNSYP